MEDQGRDLHDQGARRDLCRVSSVQLGTLGKWRQMMGNRDVRKFLLFCNVVSDQPIHTDVAQENINPMPPSKVFLPALLNARSSFGRYFVDVEIDDATELGRLTPSKELCDAFPEDDRYGASWIQGWV